jgi:hypothetical protein
MSAPAAAAAPVTEVERASSLPRRLLDAFISPSNLGRELARHPRWIGALLVVLALIALSSALLPAEMFAEVQRRAALERGVTPRPLSDQALRMIRIFSIIGGPLAVGVLTFVFSGLYTFLFAFVLGDQGRYRQYLAVTVHAGIIPALFAVVLVPLRIQTGDPRFGLNLASFLVFLEPGYLLNVFRMMDLTQLWAAAVTAWGVHEIDRRRGFTSAFVVLVGFMVAFALVMARFIAA